MLAYAVWGLIGAAVVRAVVLAEAIERVKGRPWTVSSGGPGGRLFLLAQVLHCGTGVGVAAAASSALSPTSHPVALIGFGLGTAAPTAVKKIAGYSLAFLPGKVEQPAEDNSDA